MVMECSCGPSRLLGTTDVYSDVKLKQARELNEGGGEREPFFPCSGGDSCMRGWLKRNIEAEESLYRTMCGYTREREGFERDRPEA
jgi:hypothetical protein